MAKLTSMPAKPLYYDRLERAIATIADKKISQFTINSGVGEELCFRKCPWLGTVKILFASFPLGWRSVMRCTKIEDMRAKLYNKIVHKRLMCGGPVLGDWLADSTMTKCFEVATISFLYS